MNKFLKKICVSYRIWQIISMRKGTIITAVNSEWQRNKVTKLMLKVQLVATRESVNDKYCHELKARKLFTRSKVTESFT